MLDQLRTRTRGTSHARGQRSQGLPRPGGSGTCRNQTQLPPRWLSVTTAMEKPPPKQSTRNTVEYAERAPQYEGVPGKGERNRRSRVTVATARGFPDRARRPGARECTFRSDIPWNNPVDETVVKPEARKPLGDGSEEPHGCRMQATELAQLKPLSVSDGGLNISMNRTGLISVPSGGG